MQLLQPDEESCRSEILHARVYGLDLSKGIAKAEIFFASLRKNRIQTNNIGGLLNYDLKRQSQHECHTTFNRYVSDLVDPNKNTITKHLWSFFKNKRQDSIGVGTLKHQGETFVDATDKANLLADYFPSVFTNEDVTHFPTLSTDSTPSIPPIQIHVDGIYQLLSNIQQHEASGPDNLPARFLKEVAYEILPALSLIFQASLDQGTLPSIWKTAKVVPIYKKGNKSDPCNYIDLCPLHVAAVKY